ncbi:MAG: DUF2207 domain-containing protein [Gammaproteobacteria bacterium]|nr:MAG: DUF2207 domain-containing protein [Gammaproteobacteria bacterium]
MTTFTINQFIRNLITLVLLFVSGYTAAEERILNFNSNITINADGSMLVVETIKVKSEQNKIKRGIYRDFPTKYKDRYGNNYEVGFRVIGVERDGNSENFFTKSRSNGTRVYIGNKDVILKPDIYSYKISYITTRQLGFFDEYDELYWNVTGNGWDFPIDNASAHITLPAAISEEKIRATAYTGQYGSDARNYRSEINIMGQASFQTTKTLAPREGLTIVVGWPKGLIQQPSFTDEMGFFFSDNPGIGLAFTGVTILIAFYWFSWHKAGRDPEKGIIIPRYEPPESLSPAAMRYIMNMSYDSKTFTAAVINMAVKGYLKIIEVSSDYSVNKLEDGDRSTLSAGEKKLGKALFQDKTTLELHNENHTDINRARDKLKTYLDREFNKVFFVTNGGYLVIGVIFSVLIQMAVGISTSNDVGAFIFLTIWLTGWTTIVFFLFAAKRYLVGIIFGFFELMGLGMYLDVTSLWSVILLVLLALTNVLFMYLLKAPTRLGRKVMDKIEGFKMYLSVAEQDRLKFSHPPEKTPQLFEQYLPYALALDVEQEWSEQFSEVLRKAAMEPGGGYQPHWYRGNHWSSGNPKAFTTAMGSSLSSAISSAAIAPGSGSGGGFSGGGSSGGGGGGGGGGGW